MIQARFRGMRPTGRAHLFSRCADIPALRWVFNAGVVIWLMLLSALFAMYGNYWAIWHSASAVCCGARIYSAPLLQGGICIRLSACSRCCWPCRKRGRRRGRLGRCPQVRENSHSCFQLLAIS